MSFMLFGEASSKGLVSGSVHLVLGEENGVVKLSLPDEELYLEKLKIDISVERASEYLINIRDNKKIGDRKKIASFIDTHLMMINDPMLSSRAKELVVSLNCNAEWALNIYKHEIMQVFEEISDSYLMHRREDINHIVDLLRKHLNADSYVNNAGDKDLKDLIVICKNLSPSDFLIYRQRGIAAFVSEGGTDVSHTSILARHYGIPAVTGVANLLKLVAHSDNIIVDGDNGVLIGDYRFEEESVFISKEKRPNASLSQNIRQNVKDKLKTKDGVCIGLSLNLGVSNETPSDSGINHYSVGLVRTEFLYMNRFDLPSEKEHFDYYSNLSNKFSNTTVTIRLADLGADKLTIANALDFGFSEHSNLGLRGIRFILKNPDLLVTQLRAILKASLNKNLKIMLPMVTTVAEVEEFSEYLNKVKIDLERESVMFDDNIEIGLMLEVPAAALAVELLAKKVSFMSVGTNDLIQYLNAADRQSLEVRPLYDPFNYGLIWLLRHIIDQAELSNTSISICGELASDHLYASFLLGLGFTELSVRPSSIPLLEQMIRKISVRQSKKIINNFIETKNYDFLTELA